MYLDIGFKTEGILPRTAFVSNAEGVAAGDKFAVSVKGRNTERYYELSRIQVKQAKDWTSLEEAFEKKTPVAGVVTGVVKGGLTVDVGVRAFMPASRSGVRDAAELEKLVGQEITCHIIKLEITDEDIDVVVDRRGIVEEEAGLLRRRRAAMRRSRRATSSAGKGPIAAWRATERLSTWMGSMVCCTSAISPGAA